MSASGHVFCGAIGIAALIAALGDKPAEWIARLAFACEAADNYASETSLGKLGGGIIDKFRSTGSGCGQAVPTPPLTKFVGNQWMSSTQLMRQYAILMKRVRDLITGENRENVERLTDDKDIHKDDILVHLRDTNSQCVPLHGWCSP